MSQILEKIKKVHEGKSKQVYSTDDPELFIQVFKSGPEASGEMEKEAGRDRGVLANEIATIIFQFLIKNGVKTHFQKKLGEREMLVRKLDIIPVETVMRNVAAGEAAKRLGIPEGEPLPFPILEFYLKEGARRDPSINTDYIRVLRDVTDGDVKIIETAAKTINALLKPWFEHKGLVLVDFKLAFGKTSYWEIVLGDEISPDTCRLWDKDAVEKLDKDRFLRGYGEEQESYGEVLRRIGGA